MVSDAHKMLPETIISVCAECDLPSNDAGVDSQHRSESKYVAFGKKRRLASDERIHFSYWNRELLSCLIRRPLFGGHITTSSGALAF